MGLGVKQDISFQFEIERKRSSFLLPPMARNKEALLLLIDVGPSMHALLPDIEKASSTMIAKKLMHCKYDEAGIVLFGTTETDNELTAEVGGYEHVTVLKSMKVVDGDIVDSLQQLPRGTANGDFLDAIIVGMDMLIKKFGETMKGKKRLCLITNAQYPIKDSFEGSKEDQVSTIAKQITAHGMRMECIIVRGKHSHAVNKEIVDENDNLLRIFSKETDTRMLYVEDSISLFGALRARNISLVTVYRGDLEVSPKLSIKVWVYKKTAEEKFPTLKKYSDKASARDISATHEVKVDYEYKKFEDSKNVVPPDQRIKGYSYGPQVVPISSVEWEAVKFKPEKGVKLLGFTDSKNIYRHHYMKDVFIFIAEPGNKKATLAVSALARAMKELNKVAILRCVWRQGQGNVTIGVLTPNVSDREDILDSFYLNILPFAEDVREYQFPSFSNLPSYLQPNQQQLEATDNLVKMLDLAPDGEEKVLLPEFTPNPILERFYYHLDLKSKHPDAAVPPLDNTLKKITIPDADLLMQNKSVIESFCQSFELKENPKRKKSRKHLPENGSQYGEGEGKIDITAQDVNRIEPSSDIKVEKIGDITPVQDFEVMLSRRDSPDWVDKAIKGMSDKIFDLVEDSHGGDNYPKALEYLVALRKGCILVQEPELFNKFLRHLCNFCQEKDLKSFSDYLASGGLTLISKTEAVDSEVTDDEAKSFLVKSELEVS